MLSHYVFLNDFLQVYSEHYKKFLYFIKKKKKFLPKNEFKI